MRIRRLGVILLCVLLLTGCSSVRDLSGGAHPPGQVGFEDFVWSMPEEEAKAVVEGLTTVTAEQEEVYSYIYAGKNHPFERLLERILTELNIEETESAVKLHLLLEDGVLTRIALEITYPDTVPWQLWEDALEETDKLLCASFTKAGEQVDGVDKTFGYENENTCVVLMRSYNPKAGQNQLLINYMPRP